MDVRMCGSACLVQRSGLQEVAGSTQCPAGLQAQHVACHAVVWPQEHQQGLQMVWPALFAQCPGSEHAGGPVSAENTGALQAWPAGGALCCAVHTYEGVPFGAAGSLLGSPTLARR